MRAIGKNPRVIFGGISNKKYLYTRYMNRNNLTAWLNGDALVQAVASKNNNTIVVINSVGPLILEPWIEHPNITSVVWAGLEGTETGNALVDVIYGVVNPSGRLPYTIAKSPKDYPAQLVPGGDGEEILNITYSEGCVFCVFLLSGCRENLRCYFAACSSTIAILTRRTSRRVSSLALG